jgi:hypothetical protein
MRERGDITSLPHLLFISLNNIRTRPAATRIHGIVRGYLRSSTPLPSCALAPIQEQCYLIEILRTHTSLRMASWMQILTRISSRAALLNRELVMFGVAIPAAPTRQSRLKTNASSMDLLVHRRICCHPRPLLFFLTFCRIPKSFDLFSFLGYEFVIAARPAVVCSLTDVQSFPGHAMDPIIHHLHLVSIVN